MQPQNALSPAQQATAATAEESAPVIPLKHPVRNTIAVVLVIVAALAAMDVALNERYHWDVVVDYLFAPRILTGAAADPGAHRRLDERRHFPRRGACHHATVG